MQLNKKEKNILHIDWQTWMLKEYGYLNIDQTFIALHNAFFQKKSDVKSEQIKTIFNKKGPALKVFFNKRKLIKILKKDALASLQFKEHITFYEKNIEEIKTILKK